MGWLTAQRMGESNGQARAAAKRESLALSVPHGVEFSANITANPGHAQARAWESGQQPLKARQNLNLGPSLRTHHCCRLRVISFLAVSLKIENAKTDINALPA
ncbi:MAG TPA: hypothetical protein VIU43_00515, partial [Nitrosospira sp.]